MEITFGFVVNAIIAAYLFVSAPKYGKNKWLWAVLGFLFSYITLAIFLITTGRKGLGWTLLILGIIATIFLVLLVLAMFAILFRGLPY
ncbi:hypothetical protein ACFQPF_05400 [Fictibacillus iocasae]|uniref:Uncharacterized protein n=1 Tax=Fictibacillus iocasae TaxID=2715437 RepID=A0ABW2NNB1_9BACL